jgi:two-component system chemotaxis response regulator CheB
VTVATVAYEIVVVGASWGGLHALSVLLGALPAGWALPVIVVQHRARTADNLLPELLQDLTTLPVCEVEDKQPLAGGCVYVAPPDYHLLVERGHLSLSTDPLVRYSRPSIDVMFETAADSYGAGVIGIVLTGANDDGARGLERIAARGGYAIVQDPSSAESPAMPAAAWRAVPTARVLRLEEIVPHLVVLASGGPRSGTRVARDEARA